MMCLKFLLAIFVNVLLPLLAYNQIDGGGWWVLREKTSISGPDYDNSLPKLLKVKFAEHYIEFEALYHYQEGDTNIIETLNRDGAEYKMTTITRRLKVSRLLKPMDSRHWSIESTYSAKEDVNKVEIRVLERVAVSPTDSTLTLVKVYDGSDSPESNQDYHVSGLYDYITPERYAEQQGIGAGVKFIEDFRWKDIVKKANKENKLIFVDCYATWCLPCKKMDVEVFNRNIVGKLMDQNFISVKLQMDTGKNDNVEIKRKYSLARELERKYNISALPTYLFFDSTGTLIHKEIGAFQINIFMEIARSALDPTKQIYSLAANALSGTLPFDKMALLSTDLKEKYDEKQLGRQVARKYLEDYLLKQPIEVIARKENIDYVLKFASVVKSSDKFFLDLMRSPKTYDSIFNRQEGFVQTLLDFIISNEEITQVLAKAGTREHAPDWNLIEKNITAKYGAMRAYRLLTDAKVNWYYKTRDWDMFCSNLVNQMNLLGDLRKVGWLQLNSAAWKIFEHSDKKHELNLALKWSAASIENQINDTTVSDAPWITFKDTYGNLLYKLGKRKEALNYYRDNVIKVASKDEEFVATFQKMQRGLPTWKIETE